MSASPGLAQCTEAVRVEMVTGLERLDALRDDWQALHRRDAHATVFTSWPWMRAWLGTAEHWLVLRAWSVRRRATVALAAFARVDGQALFIGGAPLSDHGGFVCEPGFETAGLGAIAERLLAWRGWRRIKLHDMLEPRLEAFLQPLRNGGRRYNVRYGAPNPCPCIALPETWEAYLGRHLTKKPRNKLKRVMRKLEALPGFGLRQATPETYPAQLADLLRLWQARWGPRPEQELARLRAIFDACFEDGRLWLVTMHQGETVIAASLGFLDRAHGTFSGYIGAFDPRYAEYSPGVAIVAVAVREAIGQGLDTFDFLRGDEQYKYETFGAETRHNENVAVVRQPLRRVLGRALRYGLGGSG